MKILMSKQNDVVIIAEVGINHNGSLEIAKKLILEAKNAGCDLVKFQKRTIDLVYTKEELEKIRETPFGNTNRDLKEALEFEEKEYNEIDKYCKEIGIEWFASAWDLKSLMFLRKYNLKYNKIASAMLTNKEFIEEVAKEKKYTFISTGGTDLYKIGKVVNIFRKEECPFELMHCNSVYPMPIENVNLNFIPELKRMYNCKVGYSGHEVTAFVICLGAVAMGASSIERHITLDRSMFGSDQSASLEISGLKNMVRYIRTLEIALGVPEKIITKEEEKVMKKLRKVDTFF